MNANGDLTLDDLVKGAQRDPEFQSRLRVMDIDAKDLEQFFDMIDADNSGSIERLGAKKIFRDCGRSPGCSGKAAVVKQSSCLAILCSSFVVAYDVVSRCCWNTYQEVLAYLPQINYTAYPSHIPPCLNAILTIEVPA